MVKKNMMIIELVDHKEADDELWASVEEQIDKMMRRRSISVVTSPTNMVEVTTS
jgi:hypothetical protein